MAVRGAEFIKEPNKLILCFDGTGNQFSGSSADTNVVKILNKLDRHHPNQYHYYQTGLGTYDINETSVNKSWFGQIRSSISQTVDQGVGTTFDAHVIAGYRFLMRYYEAGDKIYMFGFSRGAFTAKFLARMVHTVGLLCRGNEEMVPFAYRLYQRYLAGEVEDFKNADYSQDVPQPNGDRQPLLVDDKLDESHSDTYESARNEIIAFGNTFCRKEPIKNGDKYIEANVKVYFLGIWDCVNSVAVLERVPPMPVSIAGTAHFVRHAVAADERRVKFKPALLSQDTPDPTENVEEVWFPGCHGDVGGGWPAAHNVNSQDKPEGSGLWKFCKRFWTSLKPSGASKDVRTDAFQMSDMTLSWMIQELEYVATLDERAGVKWSKSKDGYKRAFAREQSQNQALQGIIHDSLVFGNCSSFFKVLLWKFLEIFPFITRWEIVHDKWTKVRFPLNNGSYRDIPRDAKLHQSLLYRLRELKTYAPKNNHGDKLEPCLKGEDGHPAQFIKVDEVRVSQELDPMHQIWTFQN
ncbi:uncharacterized protein N7496_009963 [Penicillium cataractarum]|uniref:T6SS Phospholipase effector Tle1-like catalytic domain-containing protein n=1 Tax=Penicillium cataractarum TaxID=2100454 RepID=A0A9W9RPZ0_9EURO|nr:uncharacterized protein N7496_009963 [Penicillium cataractarum]KAJ5364250.1 hypothetical protein N7496_009963 [Penicillium cataractarum]